MRAGVDLLGQPVESRQGLSISCHGLNRFVSLGVLDHKFEMQRLGTLLEISLHQLRGAGSVSIAQCADLQRNGADASS